MRRSGAKNSVRRRDLLGALCQRELKTQLEEIACTPAQLIYGRKRRIRLGFDR
jgi:hypothetical protein